MQTGRAGYPPGFCLVLTDTVTGVESTVLLSSCLGTRTGPSHLSSGVDPRCQRSGSTSCSHCRFLVNLGLHTPSLPCPRPQQGLSGTGSRHSRCNVTKPCASVTIPPSIREKGQVMGSRSGCGKVTPSLRDCHLQALAPLVQQLGVVVSPPPHPAP